MIEIRANDGENVINLPEVEDCATAADAAKRLHAALVNAAKIFGGMPYLDGSIVEWEGGPVQWALAYIVSDGATGHTFTAEAHAKDNFNSVAFLPIN